MNLIVSPAAMADVERLQTFLAESNPEAARRAVAVLSDAIQSLNSLADRGRPSVMPGARELIVPFGRSAYVLRYVHDPLTEEVVIIRIWHGREARR